ncbi:MAG: multicopper oxidase domain-containing protein [Bacteroidales bacterium]|nr:multicopper oxidase domain-containing protein [Bacteroidales bacterium]MCF8345690.1 multicopper oxidase domain-containing protein [Bacteroidales bacterium]
MKKFYKLFTYMLFVMMLTGYSSLKAQTFNNEIPVPYLMTGNDFEINISGGQHNFDPNGTVSDINMNVPLATYCYNKIGQPANEQMSYLGPTLIFTKDEHLTFDIENNLPDGANTTVHWHGLNIPGEMDGGPHQVISNASNWTPYFNVIDPVQTAWYHTHLMDLTTEQVIRGLAGLIIVEDPENDPLYSELPTDYGENDFPIVIQEKGFVLDSTTTPPTATAIKAGEKPGNGPYTLINGVVGGYLKVPPEIVRLRILNGSPRKMFHIALSTQLQAPADFTSMWMVATGGGYIDVPRPTDSTLMSVGDRREFLVDFSQFGDGDTLYMSNLSVPQDANYGTTKGDALMAFVVDYGLSSINPVTTLPANLVEYSLAPGPVFQTREKELMGSGGSGNVWTIDGTPMDLAVINDTVLVNTKERWVIHNTTNKSHPFHIHKVQFQVVEYEGKVGMIDTVASYTYPDLPDELFGYKDVQLIRAGATLTFEARFDSFPGPLQADWGYMYHCHILTHEDTSMMHQFVVVDSADFYTGIASIPGTERLSIYPNPANDMVSLEGKFEEPGVLRIYDIYGRLIRKETVSLENTTISVGDLPRGMVIFEFTSGSKRYVSKVSLK